MRRERTAFDQDVVTSNFTFRRLKGGGLTPLTRMLFSGGDSIGLHKNFHRGTALVLKSGNTSLAFNVKSSISRIIREVQI